MCSQRGYSRHSIATVHCGRRPQHLKSHRSKKFLTILLVLIVKHPGKFITWGIIGMTFRHLANLSVALIFTNKAILIKDNKSTLYISIERNSRISIAFLIPSYIPQTFHHSLPVKTLTIHTASLFLGLRYP